MMERLLLGSGSCCSREKERRQPGPRTRTEGRERVGPTTERPGPAAGSLANLGPLLVGGNPNALGWWDQ